MVCVLVDCELRSEIQRFLTCFVGVYVYHFFWDRMFITPMARHLQRRNVLKGDKVDKWRESLWKNVAVGTFFILGLYVAGGEHWFMNRTAYFVEWPWSPPEKLRWYYLSYLSFWLQSIDFLLNITNDHYKVSRKDNKEMLVHHLATISLMVFSYVYDLTRLGVCVLLIHDPNDILLESAKMFLYVDWHQMANIMFGIFAIAWYIIRLGIYMYYVIVPAFIYGYEQIVKGIIEAGGYAGVSPPTWVALWLIFTNFLVLLWLLHVYWGYLIGRMVIKSLHEGSVDKDIRSDSENEGEQEEEEKEPRAIEKEDEDHQANGKLKRRRAPKAE